MEDLQREAVHYEERQVRRFGRSSDEIVAFMQGLAALDPKVVDDHLALCKAILPNQSHQAKIWLGDYVPAKHPDQDITLDLIGPTWASLRDLGCVTGEKARATTVRGAMDRVVAISHLSRPDRVNEPECLRGQELIGRMTQYPEAVLDDPVGGPNVTWAAMAGLYGTLVFQRCVDLPADGS
jgi:hypothetical protein